MSTKNFVLDKAPYIRKVDNREYGTNRMMLDFMIALVPLILFGWIKNGLMPLINGDTKSIWNLFYPLIIVAIGGLTTYAVEFCYYRFLRGEKNIKKRMRTSFAIIPGLLLAMILPYRTPLWVLILGCIFATIFGKLLFGGFGNNIFNPALVGYLFVTTAFTSLVVGNYLNPSEELILAGATPMAVLTNNFSGGVAELIGKYPLWKIFIGLTPGALAETSALLCLISLGYLIVRGVVNWRIPVFYIGTVFVLTYIAGAFNGFYGLEYSLTYIFSGALFFGAVFMATEPVTSPRSPNGKIIFALFLGVLTVLFRFKSTMPEGVATSILIMNLFTVIVDRLAARLRVNANKRKVIINYAIIGLLVLGVGAFGVSGAVDFQSEPPVQLEITLSAQEQDFSTLNFVYTFDVDGNEVKVTVDQNYKIKSVSNTDFNTEDAKEEFNNLIKKKKFKTYIVAVDEGPDYLTIDLVGGGFTAVGVKATYDADYVLVGFDIDVSKETYYDKDIYDGWDAEDGDPANLGIEVIENQDNIDEGIEIIAGATKTVEGIKAAAHLANEYRDFIVNDPNLSLKGAYQDYNLLNIIYVFRKAGETVTVETKQDGEIITDLDAELKAEVTPLINNYKIKAYIAVAEETAEQTVLTVKALGHTGQYFDCTITLKDGKIHSFVTETANEDYNSNYNEKWTAENGHPKDIIPGEILENQDDLSEINVIAGATVTSRALIEAAKIAKEYLEAHNE